MIRKFIPISLALLIAGCATEAKYKESLDSWTGHSAKELVSSWGPPQSTFSIGSTEYLTYSHRNDVFLPGSAPTITTSFIGNMAYTNSYGGSPPMMFDYNCSTTFTVENGFISTWRF